MRIVNHAAALIFSTVFAGKPAAQITAAVYGGKTAKSAAFEVYLTFSDSVLDFAASDLAVANGKALAVTEQGQARYFSVSIEAASPGPVTVHLPAGAVSQAKGSGKNTASNSLVVSAQFVPGRKAWTVDSDADWKAAGFKSTAMEIKDGEAFPTGTAATYTSAVKTFPAKMKPGKLTFKPSPRWENWIKEPARTGPAGAGDAPIFLPVAKGDYYFLGNTDGGYAAWHSKDMRTWTAHRNIASGADLGSGHYRKGRWMTSAEYKDGKFYIIGDVPNDEESFLWIDDDLKDDKPALQSDTALFRNPAHGSDAALFRNDEDGLFHILYEDWSPIKASVRAWDSPLAGHSSSADGIHGHAVHKHHPAVDLRTTPTGRFGTYSHPGNEAPCTFEIHEPEQEAFGDWSVLKVGPRIYLFGDHDSPAGGTMNVGVFTTTSIYEEFQWIGTVASGGHPDPTSGFAEGRFHLITQFDDFTSPGPWVEEVQARAGVDADGDGTMDRWTPWQAVKESYDHKPGYARVVDMTPAQLDLSSLPEGTGFQFELKVEDKTANASVPRLDQVEMTFNDAPLSLGRGKRPQLGISSPPQFNLKGQRVPFRGTEAIHFDR